MRKKISISLATAFLMISGSAYADGNITGTVFNKTTSEPLDFATVVLVNSKTGAPLPIGTTTDENGVFIIPNAPSGKYIVRVSMIGNVTQEREITIGDSEINLGKIELAEDTKLLQEVVVTGQKSLLSVNAERRMDGKSREAVEINGRLAVCRHDAGSSKDWICSSGRKKAISV